MMSDHTRGRAEINRVYRRPPRSCPIQGFSFGQLPRLADPILALDASAEAQALIDPGDVVRRELRDLAEVVDAEPVQRLFDPWPNAADLLEFVRFSLGRGLLRG